VLGRARDLFKFQIERFLLRGTHFRLLFIAAVIGLVSVAGGLIIVATDAPHDSTAEAIWWAFLRLTDPGYLGDDEGLVPRTVSTVLTIAGYVLFMGALIAIMSTWLSQTIERLESGLTPIAQNDHILVVGNDARTATVLRELLDGQGRVRRFLARHGRRTLAIVLLAPDVTARLRQDLRERVGKVWRERQVTMRSGVPLRIGHLRRVDFANAAAIILPGNDRQPGGAAGADAATVKTLLSMSAHGRTLTDEELPRVVAEVFDGRKARIARRAYDGEVEVVSSDELIGSLLAQNIRHPNLSHVLMEIFTFGHGTSIFVREADALVGAPFGALRECFPHAIPLGIVRPEGRSYVALMAPRPRTVIEKGDRIPVLARSYADAAPRGKPKQEVPRARALSTPPASATDRRVLLLGWNHKAPALLMELDDYQHETVEVTIVSRRSIAEREELLTERELRHVKVRHEVGDSTIPGVLSSLEQRSFDSVVFMSRDWPSSSSEADAETLVSYMLLRDVLLEGDEKASPRILVELVDPSNRILFRGHPVEIVVTSELIGRLLAQVAMRRELRAVYDELLGPTGPEITFRRPNVYGIEDDEEATFAELEEAVAERGDVLIGLYSRQDAKKRRSVLQPERESRWKLAEREQLIVLSLVSGDR
jgi:Trk K+ transport system NAD-binding subunit